MIPNWLLGKSKSKLQEILGGGGGGGTTYTAGEGINITGHEISVDPVLLSDISDMDDAIPTKAAKTQLTNPNILHNPWFQVNQRGETSVSVNGLFVDRWRVSKASAGSTTFTLNSDGTITIDNSLGEAHCYFIQRRTSKTIARVDGRIITASVMLSDGTVRSGSGTYDAAASTSYYEDNDIKLQSIAQSEGQFFVLRVEAGKTITIKALKLELGSVSTLAMDTAPDMALELAKCLRYYQRVYFSTTDAVTYIAKAINGNNLRWEAHIQPMRTPTLRIKEVSAIYAGLSDGGSATIQLSNPSIAVKSPLNDKVIVQFAASGLTAGSVYSIYVKNASATNFIDFDAEL